MWETVKGALGRMSHPTESGGRIPSTSRTQSHTEEAGDPTAIRSMSMSRAQGHTEEACDPTTTRPMSWTQQYAAEAPDGTNGTLPRLRSRPAEKYKQQEETETQKVSQVQQKGAQLRQGSIESEVAERVAEREVSIKRRFDKEKQHLVRTCSVTTQENEALKQEVKSLRKAQHDANEHYAKLQEELESRDRDIRKLQSQRLQTVESAQWAPLSTSSTHHQINSMLSVIRQWSQENTPTSFDAIAEPERLAAMCKVLLHLECMAPASTQRLQDALSANRALQKPGKASTLLLSTSLSFFLFRQVLADPFFAFRDPSLSDGSRNLRLSLVQVQRIIAECTLHVGEHALHS